MDLFGMRSRRVVRASFDLTRSELIRALVASDLTIDSCQGTRIEAHAGAPWVPRRGSRRGPLRASSSVVAGTNATKITVLLTDMEQVVMDAASSKRSYTEYFQEILDRLDDRLLLLDPEMERTPTTTDEPSRALLRTTPGQLAQLGGNVARTSAKLLLPASSAQRIVGAGTACFTHGDRQAQIDAQETERIVAVAACVSADPTIPRGLADRLVRLYDDLMPLIRSRTPVVIELDERGAQLLEFVYRQAVLRQALPEREVWRCLDCGSERLTNPEVRRERTQRQNRLQITSISASAAMMMFGSASSAMSLANRLSTLDLNGGDRYSCPRCQGTICETRPATICPRCRAIQGQPVLRSCIEDGCKYDFALITSKALTWAPLTSDGPVPAAPAAESEPKTESHPTAESQPTTQPQRPTSVDPGWYPDPSGRWMWRWWNGAAWTPSVCAADGLVVTEGPVKDGPRNRGAVSG